MREIKFRAWDKTRKRIWQVTGMGFQNGVMTAVSVYVQETETIGYSILCNPYDVILLQYTGLKDSNDKEIYEGDLLTIEEEKSSYTVYWNDDRWGLKDQKGNDYDSGDYYQGYDINNWHEWTVIGNIYCKPISEMNDQELEEYADSMRSWALCQLEEEDKNHDM